MSGKIVLMMMVGLMGALRVTNNGGSTTYSYRQTTVGPAVTATGNLNGGNVDFNAQVSRSVNVNGGSSELSVVKAELHESNLENIRLRAQLDELQNDQNSNAAAQLDELQRENDDLRREVAELRGQVSVLEMVNEAKANQANADAERDQSRREQDLQNQITRLEGELSALQEENNALNFDNHRIQELEEQLSDANAEVTGLRTDIKGLEQQLNLAQINVTKQQAANKIIATKLVEMKDEIDYLRSGSGDTVKIVQRQKSSDIDFEAANEKLRNEVMDKVAQLESLQNKLNEANFEINQLNLQVTAARNEATQSLAQNSSLESDLAILTKERDDLANQVERKETQIKQLSGRTLNRANITSGSDSAEVSRVKERYQIIIENIQAEADECQQQLSALGAGNASSRVVVNQSSSTRRSSSSNQSSFNRRASSSNQSSANRSSGNDDAAQDRAARVAEILKRNKAKVALNRSANIRNGASQGNQGGSSNNRTQTTTVRRTVRNYQVGQSLD